MNPTELHATDFSNFFTALWDRPPFAWQKELAKRVLENAAPAGADESDPACSSNGQTPRALWPGAIALPTASGKTACMDIAVFALASQAPRVVCEQTITAPRRIFFVVDRRVIVDEAYERARRLAKKLEDAKEGILKQIADNLRLIAGGAETNPDEERPLAAYILRGGMYRSEAWVRHPLQPAIVASTVDQIGSRLLFRAYGRGPRTWPIHAGLIANDSLILLDEAHCAQPFMQTLRAIQRYQTWAHEPLGRPFHPVIMSATPPPGTEDVFEDTSEERRDPAHPLGRRQLASKPAELKVIKESKGSKATAKLAKALVKAALGLCDEERRAIVVFVNRVATARETYRLLVNDKKHAILLTGRMRPIDKDDVVKNHLAGLKSDKAHQRSLPEPVIVVATQTLEVGADLDFDGLVSECASLDALRQRFGRLNRTGRDIEAKAVVLIRGDQVDDKEDPVYGKALAKTWDWLNDNKDENKEINFGIAQLEEKLPGDASLDALNMPTRNAPIMLPAHVDCWTQTAPEPNPSPDVAPFLHGERESKADVQVCWRAGLNLTTKETRQNAIDTLSLCPPSSSETLPVPVGVFKRWLAGEGAQDDSADADVEGISPTADTKKTDLSSTAHPIIRWRGSETKNEHITSDPEMVKPGDIIVIPTDHPQPVSELGDLPEGAELDVGDRSYRISRAKPILRLHSALVEAWPASDSARTRALTLLKDLEQKHENDPDEVTEALYDLLTELSGSPKSSWLSDVAIELRKEFSRPTLRDTYQVIGGNSLVLVGRRGTLELAKEADNFSDEDDTTASGISHRNGRPVKLGQHLPGVETFARRHALGCGLPNELVDAIACAGLLHDLGKADPRFQSLLRGGGPWLGGEPLAKSARMPKTRGAFERARKKSGYPKGGRHELLSVRMAESTPEMLPKSSNLRDLVLHLIASHHGYCRPLAPVVFDDQDIPVSLELCNQQLCWRGPTHLERLDSGIADRYWRLVRHYGWWGLAWLEALLRLADWRRSEWEETHNDDE